MDISAEQVVKREREREKRERRFLFVVCDG